MSVRGIDFRDSVKTERDKQRFKIAYEKENYNRRPDLLLSNIKDNKKELKPINPVVSKRGSDNRHQVLEGRKKAQYNKANTPFMSYSQPVDAKIKQGIFF